MNKLFLKIEKQYDVTSTKRLSTANARIARNKTEQEIMVLDNTKYTDPMYRKKAVIFFRHINGNTNYAPIILRDVIVELCDIHNVKLWINNVQLTKGIEDDSIDG